MNRTRRAKMFVLMLFVVLAVPFALHAMPPAEQQQQAAPAQGPKAGEQKPQAPATTPATGPQQAPPEPKNLQVLKGMSRPQVVQVMREWASALGVECNFCHVNPFETDTPRKNTARLMMRDYVAGMKHRDGSAVTCNECHKGQPNFLRVRPFEDALGKDLPSRRVLTGMADDKVLEVMTAFTKALGVECTYCHTDKLTDETPRKQVARFMMTGFSRVLAKTDGSAVGCNDCHQGHARPLAVLPFPRRPERRPETPSQPATKKPGV